MSQEHRINLAVSQWSVKLGVDISSDPFTRAWVYDADPARGYEVCLIGPLYDPTNPDVRLWVTDRTLDGTRVLSLRVQDCDDDVMLNVGAEGIEKYNVGDIWVKGLGN